MRDPPQTPAYDVVMGSPYVIRGMRFYVQGVFRGMLHVLLSKERETRYIKLPLTAWMAFLRRLQDADP